MRKTRHLQPIEARRARIETCSFEREQQSRMETENAKTTHNASSPGSSPWPGEVTACGGEAEETTTTTAAPTTTAAAQTTTTAAAPEPSLKVAVAYDLAGRGTGASTISPTTAPSRLRRTRTRTDRGHREGGGHRSGSFRPAEAAGGFGAHPIIARVHVRRTGCRSSSRIPRGVVRYRRRRHGGGPQRGRPGVRRGGRFLPGRGSGRVESDTGHVGYIGGVNVPLIVKFEPVTSPGRRPSTLISRSHPLT